jgi:APA family basic amino acid/polyamine antiporter
VFIVLAVTAILVVGIKESARFNGIIVLVKVAVVLMFIATAAPFVRHENWVPVHSRQHRRLRQIRHLRNPARRDHGVLRLHRLRRRLDRGAGNQESAARSAHRHSRIAGHLHGSLHRRRAHPDRRGSTTPSCRCPTPSRSASRPPARTSSNPWSKIGAIAGLSSVMLVLLLGQPRIFFSMARFQAAGPFRHPDSAAS